MFAPFCAAVSQPLRHPPPSRWEDSTFAPLRSQTLVTVMPDADTQHARGHNPKADTPTEIKLSHPEFRILFRFMSPPRRVFSRVEIRQDVWEPDAPSKPRDIEASIRRLRLKLETHGVDYFDVIRGVGFRLLPPAP